MRLHFFVVAAVVAIAMTSGLTAGQQGVPGVNETETTETTPTTKVVIDNETRITDWWYEDGEFVMQIEADDAKPITLLSLPSSRGEGGGRLNVKRTYIARGNNTVRFRAGGSDPAVTITTGMSIENGRVAYLKTSTGIDLFGGPARWRYVWIAGAVSFAGGIGAVLYYAREFLLTDDPEVAERVL